MKEESKYRSAALQLLTFLYQTANENNITHDDIANISDWHRTNVSRMLSGKYMPSLDNFLKLATAIGVRIELHSPTDAPPAQLRNIDTPEWLFAPDHEAKELYILHTHTPACLIKVMNEIPARFAIVETYDNIPVEDLTRINEAVTEFFKKWQETNSGNLN